jgi:hypothetical protein
MRNFLSFCSNDEEALKTLNKQLSGLEMAETIPRTLKIIKRIGKYELKKMDKK